MIIESGTIEINDLRDDYVDLVRHVRDNGRAVAPRGQGTRELLNCTIKLNDPLDALPVNVGRKPNLSIGAGEAIQLIGGFSDPEMMVSITKTFERFMDAGSLEGTYGPRIKTYLPPCIQRLREDPDSRQAVVQVGRPDDYFGTPSRDLPCTKDFHFFIRDGALDMITSMRSNDVFLGVAYDFFQFTQLQASVAKAMGIPIGVYYHHADSLHLYDRNLDQIEMLHHAGSNLGVYPEHYPRGIGAVSAGGYSIEQMQKRAYQLWSNDLLEGMTESETWYRHQLSGHTRRSRLGL